MVIKLGANMRNCAEMFEEAPRGVVSEIEGAIMRLSGLLVVLLFEEFGERLHGITDRASPVEIPSQNMPGLTNLTRRVYSTYMHGKPSL